MAKDPEVLMCWSFLLQMSLAIISIILTVKLNDGVISICCAAINASVGVRCKINVLTCHCQYVL